MYGIFCNEGGCSRRVKSAILQGRIIVESRSVVWQEVHDIGFFEERFFESCPIDWYTVMA